MSVFSDKMSLFATYRPYCSIYTLCVYVLQLDQAVDGVSGETDRMLSSQVTRHRCVRQDIMLWQGGSLTKLCTMKLRIGKSKWDFTNVQQGVSVDTGF